MTTRNKEEEFFNGVAKLVSRTPVPFLYVAHGFMSPDCASILFGLAANMEAQGASFPEQQLATAKFIEEMWNDLSAPDKAAFARMTAS